MEILAKNVGSVNVVCPCGRLDAIAAGEIEKILNPLADSAQVLLVVNLEKLEK